VASDVILRELQLTKKDDPSYRSWCRCRIWRRRAASRSRATRSWPSRARQRLDRHLHGKIVYGGTLEKVGVSAEAVPSGTNGHLLADHHLYARAA
jgi:hypothetical protein